MPILLTDAQRHELDTRGWFVVERVLQGAELERVSAAFDEVADRKRALDGLDDGVTVSWRNGLARHPDIMDLLDHERILSLGGRTQVGGNHEERRHMEETLTVRGCRSGFEPFLLEGGAPRVELEKLGRPKDRQQPRE